MLELKGTNFSLYRWGPEALKGQVTYTRSHGGRSPASGSCFFHLKHDIYGSPTAVFYFYETHEFPRYFSKLILML